MQKAFHSHGRHNGLRYFVIGDASPQNLDKLSGLIKAAS
jgi:hypothetical protein